ncbi:uncharacterized protein CDAR_455101 [Caerostris darwini]|uniref:Uncharacterized protein n=1 Tax=Caerostris darwini TaxID=1538125 RepID=A0AAV4RDM3_9ARAC|nr:uncharacterized protein CDAR_455101 [Caerostris darwini]
MKDVEPASVPKRGSSKATKATAKPQSSTTVTTAASARSTTAKSSSVRSTSRPKGTKRTTTTASPSTTASTIATVVKQNNNRSSSANKKKQNNKATATTTTVSPIEIMNRLYQMHGLASHGIATSHANYPSSLSSSKKKEQHQASSSMDDIYRLHAMALAQASHGPKKSHSSSSNSASSETSSTTKKPSESSNSKQGYPKHPPVDYIYQQHSSLPSSMHHIMAQHSVSHGSSSRPQKTSSSSSSSQESSGSSLSTLMQPLLKQLTPVGAGIGVVLAPLLLFNGFLQFFSNMSRFLNNFAQSILPVRRPLDQNPQNQNSYFQNLGPAHLKRQPRDRYINPQNMAKIQEFTELFMKALKEAEIQ